MTRNDIEKAMRLKEKIDELDTFIFKAERDGFWEKIVFKKELKIFTNVHGFDEDEGYRLNKELSLKVIEVLKEQLGEWEGELERI